MTTSGLEFIAELERIVNQRLQAPAAGSYTASLAAEGAAPHCTKGG